MTFDLTFAILKEMLDDIVVLDEPELEEGVRAALRYTHNLAEGSGAARLRRRRNTAGSRGEEGRLRDERGQHRCQDPDHVLASHSMHA